jgi:CelD/BcsL family acetyltransferase involved in cellulose biosynthesis
VDAWATNRGVQVELLNVDRAGSLVAALPVVRAGRTIATPTDWHTPRFEATAADEAMVGELASLVVRRLPARVRLGFLDAEGATFRAFSEALGAAGYRLRARMVLRSPYISVDGVWEDYLALRPGKWRADLRRRRRRLDEKGAVAFEVIDASDRLDALLTEGFEVEASGWKGTGGTAILYEGTDTLYRDAARWAADEGMLRLAFLRVDGRAIAFDYCFEADGVHTLVKTGFRPEFAAYAPGKLLRALMVERAFGEGIRIYDFAGDADPWKMEWTDRTRRIVTLEAFAPTIVGRMFSAVGTARRTGRRVAKRLRRRHP